MEQATQLMMDWPESQLPSVPDPVRLGGPNNGLAELGHCKALALTHMEA